MLKQINSLGTEKTTPENTDIIPIQQADGITRHITRANFLAGITAESSYPNSFCHWHDESIVLSGSPLTNDSNSAYKYFSITYQPNAAIGDSCSFDVFIDAGNYAVNFLVHAASNRGIFSVYLDDLLTHSDLDTYGSGMMTITRNLSILTPGIHTIKIVTSGKRTASTGYFILLTKVWGIKL